MSAEKHTRNMLLALMADLRQISPDHLAGRLARFGFDSADVTFHVTQHGQWWTTVHRWPWEERTMEDDLPTNPESLTGE